MEIICDRQRKRGVESLTSDQDVRLGDFVHGETVPLTVSVVDQISQTSTARIWNPIDVSTGTLKAAIGRGFALPVAGSFTLISGTLKTSGSLTIDQRYLISDYNSGDDFTNVGAVSNATGEYFTATGTTPTTWTNLSSLQEVTEELDYDCVYSDVQTALNALPSIIANGGVAVSGSNGFFTITWDDAASRGQITGDASNLAPLSLIDAGTLVNGSSLLREVQTIQIVQDAGAFINLSTNSSAASVDVTAVQAGSAGANAQYRVLLDPSPYDGQFTLTVRGIETGFISYNSEAADVVTALEEVEKTSGTLISGARYKIVSFVAGDNFTNVGAASNATGVVFTASGTTPTTWTNSSILSPVASGNVSVSKEGAGQWLIMFVGDMAGTDLGTITGNASGLSVVSAKSGTLDLRTAGISLMLGQASTAEGVFEIQYTPAGGTPQIIFRRDITVIAPVIKPASATPTPRESYPDPGQLVQVRLDITDKTGGASNAIDSIVTSTITLPATGTIYLFKTGVSGAVQGWQLISGTDAEDAPAGIVRPDDYASTTNEKVFKQVF